MWLAGILKDACRERLEKNLVSQAFEERLYQRGPVEGRLDPRPFLKIWEPRYRKLLDVAAELHSLLEAEEARVEFPRLGHVGDGDAHVIQFLEQAHVELLLACQVGPDRRVPRMIPRRLHAAAS